MLGGEEPAWNAPATRVQLAEMLVPLADPALAGPQPADTDRPAARLAAANKFFPWRAAASCRSAP